jgi:hypothetical protein
MFLVLILTSVYMRDEKAQLPFNIMPSETENCDLP